MIRIMVDPLRLGPLLKKDEGQHEIIKKGLNGNGMVRHGDRRYRERRYKVKIGVCGVACEKCPMMIRANCPNGEQGCTPKENEMCKIATCAFNKGVGLCFECPEFPCETTKTGPINYGYCQFISGKGP